MEGVIYPEDDDVFEMPQFMLVEPLYIINLEINDVFEMPEFMLIEPNADDETLDTHQLEADNLERMISE